MAKEDSVPENRLIYGDNLAIMSALLADYEGRLDLIYADPPFFTNRRFPARIGRNEDLAPACKIGSSRKAIRMTGRTWIPTWTCSTRGWR